MGVGARNKGQLKNKVTGQVMSFQYNPSSINSNQGVRYAKIDSCGASYPSFHYVGGEAKNIKFKLFLFGKEEVERQISFLEELIPDVDRWAKFETPPHVLYVFGKTVHTTVVTTYNKNEITFDENLNPIHVEIDLELQVLS